MPGRRVKSAATTGVPLSAALQSAVSEDASQFDLPGLRQELKDFRRRCAGAVIGVVFGPRSTEDRFFIERTPATSLSLTAVMDSLTRQGFAPQHLDSTSPLFTEQVKSVDVVFVNAHGEYGEDGRLQGLLDYLGKPYTGSGVLTGAVGLNKLVFKRVMTGCGIPVARYAVPHRTLRPLGVDEMRLADIPLPAIAKPVGGGSSVGMRLLASAVDLGDSVGVPEPGELLVEEFLPGRSVTVAVLDVRGTPVAAPPMEISFDGEFYDEIVKLDKDGGAQAQMRPLAATKDVVSEVERIAVRVHEVMGCRGFSRVDVILGPDGDVRVLEINTIPGMTRRSNFVACTAALGLTYDETVLLMLHSATLPHILPA